MQTFVKVILIFFVFMIGGLILAALKDSNGGRGHGPMGIIIALSLFAAIRAIWNYGKEEDKGKKENESAVEKTNLDKN